jgi:hypothetical protein
MPTRLLKQSICTSRDINRLTPEEEVFFYRLIVNCDDHGYFQADPNILRGRLYPKKIDLITPEIICERLKALVNNEMATVFETEGTYYLCLTGWKDHQQIRAKRFKHPHLDENSRILQADEITCKQLLADVCKCPRNPIQSNPIQTIATSHLDLIQLFKDDLSTKYQGIDLDHEIEKCWTYWQAIPSRKRPNWKLRLMNWLDRVKERTGSPDERPYTGR